MERTECIIESLSNHNGTFDKLDQGRKRYPNWLWIFIALTLLITTLPYWLGFASQADNWQFTGFVFGVQDGNSYIAKMLRGSIGDWLFFTPYTSLPQKGALFFLPYILIGKLSAPPAQHIQLVVLYQLFRLFAGIISILASYDFLTAFLREERWHKWGMLLIVWGGGLGWMLLFVGKSSWLGSLPLEMYSPESFGFLALYGLPHLALMRGLFLWGLRTYMFPEYSPGRVHAGVYVGLLWLVMGLIQPLTVALSWMVISAYLGLISIRHLWITRNNRTELNWSVLLPWWLRAIIVGLVSAPIVVYTLWVFYTDPVLMSWGSQNQIIAPHPAHYLIAYGLLVPFAIISVRILIKMETGPSWLLIAWSLALPIFVMGPFPMPRRLAEGYWVALVVLALVGFERYTKRALQRLQWILILTLPSTLFLLIGGVQYATNPGYPLFRPQAEVTAFGYLQQNVAPNDVLLASNETSNAAPAWIPIFVVIGHGPESVNNQETIPRVNAFYEKSTSNTDRLVLINEFSIDYVFWGPQERALGAWVPDQSGFLEKVYDQAGYAIYRTLPANP